MSFDHLLGTFVTEARELLQDMESSLLACEAGTGDADSINAIFRAAHTIKGSAGLFGLAHIVRFTHVVETTLDRVRSGGLALSARLVTLLLECCDLISAQVNLIGSGELNESAEQAEQSARLSEGLKAVAGVTNFRHDPSAPESKESSSPTRAQPAAADEAETDAASRVSSDDWHISVRFDGEVLRNGMDPLSIIRYLCTFGEITAVEVVTEGLPPLERFDPEVCYLGFEIAFRTNADKARIESAFDFVRSDCKLAILPPDRSLDDFVRLINERQESHERLGEILVACGSLTSHELGQALSLQAQLRNAGASPAIGKLLVDQKVVQAPVVSAALEAQDRSRQQARQLDTLTIRVEAAKLDGLIDLIGELIVAGAGTETAVRQEGLPSLMESAGRLARLVEKVRDSALTLRMVQIGATFSRFQRVVREASAQLGKEVVLDISGAETELDKTMVERIADPLMHLVRNAVDHGIEMPDVRVSRGKPRRGTLQLKARHDSGSVVIDICDDGAGINRARVRAKAVERGLIAPDAVLTDDEVLKLIFAPGFSTATEVTNLSGRGVGMDVVKRNIEQLRGMVDIESTEGVGSTVRLRLPLTLAIIDGFLLRVGSASYVVPLDVVDECVELSTDSSVGENDYLDLRGVVIPILRLRQQFRVEAPLSRRQNVVVIRWGAKRLGLVVDTLHGKLQAVIKPLSRVLSALPGVTGSTILGDGTVALILDIAALAAQVEHRPRSPVSPSFQSPRSVEELHQ